MNPKVANETSNTWLSRLSQRSLVEKDDQNLVEVSTQNNEKIMGA